MTDLNEAWNILKLLKDDKKHDESNVKDGEQDICIFCNKDTVILRDGNYSCESCGSLVSRFIDAAAEWRYYGNEDSKGADPTRCGMPSSEYFPDAALGSMIGYGTKETYEIRLMRKYSMWNFMTYKERSLYNVFDVLTQNAVNNSIPKSIIDEAKMLYKKLSEMQLSRGDNRNGLIASSIYMACKNNKVPRSAKEIAKIFNLKGTVMTRGCKKFQEIMKINTANTTPEDFIARFCSKLNIDKNMKDICKQVVKKVEDLDLMTENTPPSIAASIIYLCNVEHGWNLVKKDLAEACGVSQVTITKCHKKLSSYKSYIM